MNSHILLGFYFIAISSCYFPADGITKLEETMVVDLNSKIREQKVLKPAHKLLSARDWNGPATALENTYFLKQNNVLYFCTAAAASLCPHLYGKEWAQNSNRFQGFVKTRSWSKFTLSLGSLEYSCSTIFMYLCPVIPGGVWVRTDPVHNGVYPAEAKVRENRIRSPTVSCFSPNEQICRNLKTDESWVIKRRRNIGEVPGPWTRNVSGAELFCSSPDVENCPFNDGTWVKAVASNLKQLELNKNEKNLSETGELATIQRYRTQKKIHDATKKNNTQNDGNEKRKLDLEKSKKKDEKKHKKNKGEDVIGHDKKQNRGRGSSPGSQERERIEHKSGSSRDQISHVNQSSENDRDESKTSESTEEGFGSYTYNGTRRGQTISGQGYDTEIWKGVVQSEEPNRSDLDRSDDSSSIEDEGSKDSAPIRRRHSRKKVQEDSLDSSVRESDSATDQSDDNIQPIKSWSLKMNKIELICRAHNRSECPKMMKYGRKTAIHWHSVNKSKRKVG